MSATGATGLARHGLGVDVVVLDLDGGSMLDDCLASLQRQTLQPLRILIVDNGSRLPVAERIQPDARVTILRSETNLGFTGGINLAMSRVEAPLVAWVNNDVLLEPEWLEVLHDRLAEDAALAGVQSLILRADGRIDGAGIGIERGRFVQLAHGAAPDTPVDERPWGISATAALWRVDALRRAAGGGETLHPRFFAYYEDVELAARLREAGSSVALVRRPLAVHRGSVSAQRLGARAGYLRVRNRYWVRRLHRVAGSLPALLAEDLREMGKSLPRAGVAEILMRLRGCAAGLLGPI
ncbi:MAG TPA: glycosyltransferase family 2 protein [Thermoanaerobaculia bacterium]|nr:glycosyltransferase family 2 protein [Thermoanaerobaculia bacterium]